MASPAPAHPTPRQLLDFAQGKLPAGQAATVADHLGACPTCLQRVERAPDSSFTGRLRQAGAPSRLPAAGASASRAAAASERAHDAAPAAVCPDDLPDGLRDHPKFRVVRLLGRGGMGTVYLAQHKIMQRPVALKVVSPALVANPEALARFHNEVVAVGTLSHDHIVQAYDAEQAGGLHLLVMEYVDGHSLADLVARRGPLPVAAACRLVRQAALGLQHAHDLGMVHRDIKPHNLMVTRGGQLKILDFGLARLAREQVPDTNLTRDNAYMGTAEYMAPEQSLDARTADIRADIYSLGCTLYCLLTAHPPFPGDTPGKQFQSHLAEQAPSLHTLRTQVPEELAAVVATMMAKDPAARFQTPAEVAAALLPFLPGTSTPSRPPGPFGGTALPVGTPETAAKAPSTSPSRAPASPPAGADWVLSPPLPDRPPKRQKWSDRARVALARCPRRWLAAGGAAIVAAAVLGGLALWAAVITVKTPEGAVEVEINEPGARVTVDGRLIDIQRKGKAPIRVTVVAGQAHELRIEKDGCETQTRKFTVTQGEKKLIEVRLVKKEAVAAKLPDPPPPPPVRPVCDGFAANDGQGWTTRNQDDSGPSTRDLRVDGPKDGNYWLVARDADPGKEWGWHAPAKYHGDHADKFGRKLKYCLFAERVGRTPESDWYLRLKGGGLTLVVDGTVLSPPPNNGWKSYEVFLDTRTAWKRWTGSRLVPATDDDLRQALRDVTDLRFKGEFASIHAVGCLDSVRFGVE